MAALNSIGLPVALAPPDVPASVPAETAGYLRKLSVWMAQQLVGKMPAQTAIPGILFLASDGSVWKLAVQPNGAFSVDRVPGGSTPT